jgi:glucose-1-phosphate thymidylyltransferase
MIERVLGLLTAHGVQDVILVASPDDPELVAHFRNHAGAVGRLQLVYQPERLGMAHALRCAAHLINGPFILSACDNLVPVGDVGQLMATWSSASRPDAVLALLPVEPDRLGSVGIVELDGPWVTRIVEKPGPDEAPSDVSSLPLYCFSTCVLDLLPEVAVSLRGEYEIQDAIQLLIERGGRVRGMLVQERMTLTHPADLLAINRHYLWEEGGVRVATETVGPGARFVAPVRIDAGVEVGADSTVGPAVYAERGCAIGRAARICDSVILRGAVIADGAVLAGQVLSEQAVGE